MLTWPTESLSFHRSRFLITDGEGKVVAISKMSTQGEGRQWKGGRERSGRARKEMRLKNETLRQDDLRMAEPGTLFNAALTHAPSWPFMRGRKARPYDPIRIHSSPKFSFQTMILPKSPSVTVP